MSSAVHMPTESPAPAVPRRAAALVVEARRSDGAPRRVALLPVEAIDFYPAEPEPEPEGGHP